MAGLAQGEIDAQEDSFKATSLFGQSLIADSHFASDEVKEKVTIVCSHGHCVYMTASS